jgi:hypothetical protein
LVFLLASFGLVAFLALFGGMVVLYKNAINSFKKFVCVRTCKDKTTGLIEHKAMEVLPRLFIEKGKYLPYS